MEKSSVEKSREALRTAMCGAMVRAMSAEERGRFITRFTQVNPNWRGRTLDLMIDRLMRDGAHAKIVDAMFDEHGQLIASEFGVAGPGAIQCAVYWAVYAYGFREPQWGPMIYPLALRLKHVLDGGSVQEQYPAPARVAQDEAFGSEMDGDDVAYRDGLAKLMLDHRLIQKLEERVDTGFAEGIIAGRDVERMRVQRVLNTLIAASERVSSFWEQWTERRPVDMHGAIMLLGEAVKEARGALTTPVSPPAAGGESDSV